MLRRNPEKSRGAIAVSAAVSLRLPNSGWLLSPARDLLLFIGLPLVIFIGLTQLVATNMLNQSYFLLWGMFSLGHHLPGFIKAYGDRRLYLRHRLLLILAPPLTFLAVYASIKANLPLFLTLLSVWAQWHGFMQSYGIIRAYDHGTDKAAKFRAGLDRALVALLYLVCNIFWYQDAALRLAKALLESGIPVVSGASYALASSACVAGFTAFAVCYFAYHLWQTRIGPKTSPMKLWYVALLILFMVALTKLHLFSGVFILFAFELHHDIQYFAIAYAANCRTVAAHHGRGRLMRAFYGGGWLRAALYMAAVFGYGCLHYVNNSDLGTAAPVVFEIFAAFVGTSSLLHYYYDGFIWRRDALAERVQQQSPLAWFKSAGPRVWQPVVAALLLACFGLGLANNAPFDEVRRAYALAKLLPRSANAKVDLAKALARRGSQQLAQNLYTEALALDADLVTAHLGLAEILNENIESRDAAEAHFKRALTLYPAMKDKIELSRRVSATNALVQTLSGSFAP